MAAPRMFGGVLLGLYCLWWVHTGILGLPPLPSPPAPMMFGGAFLGVVCCLGFVGESDTGTLTSKKTSICSWVYVWLKLSVFICVPSLFAYVPLQYMLYHSGLLSFLYLKPLMFFQVLLLGNQKETICKEGYVPPNTTHNKTHQK